MGKTWYIPSSNHIFTYGGIMERRARHPYEAAGPVRLPYGAGALCGPYEGLRAKTAKVPSSCTRENPSPESESSSAG